MKKVVCAATVSLSKALAPKNGSVVVAVANGSVKALANVVARVMSVGWCLGDGWRLMQSLVVDAIAIADGWCQSSDWWLVQLQVAGA